MLRRVLGVCVGAIVLALLSGGSARAQEQPPPVVVVSSPAELAFEDGTATVKIRNDTAATVDISRRWTEGGSEPAAAVDGPGAISAGGSVALTVSWEEGQVPSSDVTLVVLVGPSLETAPTGFVLRVALSTVERSRPAADAWAMTVRTLGGAEGTSLPLTGPCSNLGITDGDEVGTVQGGGVSRPVTATCECDSDHAVELHVPRAGWESEEYGVLKGTIDFGGGKPGQVALEVTTTTGLFPFLVLVGVGVGAAIWVGVWRGYAREDLLFRAEAMEAAYAVHPANPANADAGFQAAAVERDLDEPIRQWSVRRAFEARIEQIVAKLERDRDQRVADPIATARQSLGEVTASIGSWPEAANLLGDLSDSLRVLRRMRRYWAEAEKRTLSLDPSDGQLTLEQIAGLRATANEALELVKRLDESTIARVEAWSDAYPDNPRARNFRRELDLLGRVSSPAEIGPVITQLLAAQSAVIAWPDFEDQALGLELEAAGASTLGPPAATADPTEHVRAIVTKVRRLDLVVFFVLVIVAVVGAVVALWDGKAFGGWVDWASAVGWGLGSAVVSGTLTSASGDLRQSGKRLSAMGVIR